MLALADVHPHDGHAVTHHHRRHAIRNADRHPVAVGDIRADVHHQHECTPVAQPVTVSDLLDAYYAAVEFDDEFHWGPFYDVLLRADHQTDKSFCRLRSAIGTHRALSPDERAEYDRRTT